MSNRNAKLKYMNAVADYLIELGYQVEEPDVKNELIDVWGVGGDVDDEELFLSKVKYYLEIEADGFEAPCDEGRWLGYGLIVTEGNSLAECLDNACVDLIDQDGGEYAMREADSPAMQDAIEKAFMAKYPPEVPRD